jgi:DNA-dependent RNA polymerase auxiliary subunit epsilon
MSNDGNKSTKRAPFTMFSSSAGGGYLDSFHTNFSGGVEINNLHTDVYGNYRNPPAQGPFNDDLVGGLAYRHQDVGSTSDRQEGFLINAQTGSIAITQTGRVQVYRDEYAKRPLNIRNIKEISGAFGNYEKEYEVVQIAGRTLNPRHFVEFPEQYTTDYPLHKGTENPVFNTLDADGNPVTGSLLDYTLPDLTGSTDQFVFVNKFSAPGDRYTMSRGFLNPKGEEFSAYNASPFRNLNIRQENNENLTTHNEQFTAVNHPENRNPDYRLVPAALPGEFFASPGMTVTATSATASAGVWAQQIYSLNGATLFTSASAGLGTAGAVVIGLDADPSSSTNYTDIDYGWYLDTSTTAAVVIESGVTMQVLSE